MGRQPLSMHHKEQPAGRRCPRPHPLGAPPQNTIGTRVPGTLQQHPEAAPGSCSPAAAPTRASRPADSSSAPSDTPNTGVSQLHSLKWLCSFMSGGRCAGVSPGMTSRLKYMRNLQARGAGEAVAGHVRRRGRGQPSWRPHTAQWRALARLMAGGCKAGWAAHGSLCAPQHKANIAEHPDGGVDANAGDDLAGCRQAAGGRPGAGRRVDCWGWLESRAHPCMWQHQPCGPAITACTSRTHH